MGRVRATVLATLLMMVGGCPTEEDPPPPPPEEPTPPDPVHGWILLDSDPDAVVSSLDAAVEFGVDYVQLSHGLIMDIDDILGDDAEAQQTLERLQFAAAEAEARGIRTHIWSHEWSDAGPSICYDPDDPIWEQRAQAYRDGLALIPEVDGVVLMFGSADFPPWFTGCACDWCLEQYPDAGILEAPPNDVRIRMMTERIGGVIVDELGMELVARTFIHEPMENAWHTDGFGAVEDLDFVGMHKSDVQDWQPYNPPSPTMGVEGDLFHLMEVDVAGEYYGKSELPFCAPEYFAWRLDHSRAHRGFGTVARVERGSMSALGTPNEVNVAVLAARFEDPDRPVDEVWDEWIERFYGLPADDPAQPTLKAILRETFAVRLKSHYVLGIWALDKGSDIPDSYALDQLDDRGEMPKWDPDWQELYDGLVDPDRAMVIRVWQEGTEAIELADLAWTESSDLDGVLTTADYEDLRRRLRHQWYGARARAWAAVKLFLWARMAITGGHGDGDVEAWLVWAHEELGRVATEMEADGLGDVSLVHPSRIESFRADTAWMLPDGVAAAEPAVPRFSAMRTYLLEPNQVGILTGIDHDAWVTLEWGTEIPDFGTSSATIHWTGGEAQSFSLELEPRQRYVFRLRADVDGTEYVSGYHWVFIPAE